MIAFERFFKHYGGCDDCLLVPIDAEQLEAPGLCEIGEGRWINLGYVGRHTLAELATQHTIDGVRQAENQTPPPALKEVGT